MKEGLFRSVRIIARVLLEIVLLVVGFAVALWLFLWLERLIMQHGRAPSF